MAVPLRAPADGRLLAISQTSFLPGSAERGDLFINLNYNFWIHSTSNRAVYPSINWSSSVAP
jgi:hypothetical protein